MKNILKQTASVEVNQVVAVLDDLGLAPEQRKEAETVARELADEAQGEQRWPVLAESLAKLKALGKHVYEKIAIPLLLDMLKRQAGLDD